MELVLKGVRNEVASILEEELMLSEVEDAMMGAYGYTAQCIADESFVPVRMQYIGEWAVKDYHKNKALQRRYEKQQQLLNGGDSELPPEES